MQHAFPEFVTDAINLHGEHVGRAAARLTTGMDAQTALKLAIEVIVGQRREIASLGEELEDVQAEHERLVGTALVWLEKHPDADPDGELEGILENSL